MRLVRGGKYTYRSPRNPCVSLAFSCARSFLVFMLEFAYASEGVGWKCPLEASWFPTSLLQIVRGNIEPLNLKQEGKCFWIRPVGTVHVCRGKTAQPSRKQPLLSIPLSLEQMGVVFLGLFALQETLTVGTHDPGSRRMLLLGVSVTLDPKLLTQPHSFPLLCHALCPSAH